MERKWVICLFLFVFLMLVISSCHSRQFSDVRLAMTKEQVISLWGPTDLITYKTVIRPLMGQLLKHGNTILLALILSVGSLLFKIG